MTDTDPPLNEWIYEEKKVPSSEVEVIVDAKGNPVDFKVVETEKVETEKVAYATLTPHNICASDQHYFEIRDGGKRRGGRLVVQCRRCALGKNFVVGVHQLVDGNILTCSRPPISGAAAAPSSPPPSPDTSPLP